MSDNTLTITAGALDVIAAAHDHLDALTDAFGPTHPYSINATASLARCLTTLVQTPGLTVSARSSDPLSLSCTSPSGSRHEILFVRDPEFAPHVCDGATRVTGCATHLTPQPACTDSGAACTQTTLPLPGMWRTHTVGVPTTDTSTPGHEVGGEGDGDEYTGS